MELGLSGLASGFDWRAFVDQMVEVERAPQQRLFLEQSTLEQQKTAYGSIKTQLAVLQNRVDDLKEPSLFQARGVQVGTASVASATVSAGAPLGQHTFNFTQLASAARLLGSSNIGRHLSATNDVSGVMINSAGFTTPIAAGTFTVNGKQVAIEAADSLQGVFTKISDATGGSVTASYDSATDQINFSSAGEIILGSATDTSNFLRASKLYNNGTGTISSSSSLGGIQTNAVLSSGTFATPIEDGGAGAGLFKINGVEIAFNSSTDSLNNVIDRINNSDAGVLASYDAINDRLVLSNKTTGDIGISVEDVTGNFLAASGVTAGALERGKNLLYSINGGGELVSESNTITEESSGIPGLSITALQEATTTITVSSDTTIIKKAIQDFIEDYNKTQTLIDQNTASSTDEKGKVTAGTLATENDADSIAAKLRATVYAAVSGFALDADQLADLGIVTNGIDNTLALADPEALDAALASNLNGVQKLFTDGTGGIATKMSTFLEATTGDEGTLQDKDTNLARQIAAIDTQMTDLERIVQSNRQRLIDSFIAMETAQAQINQQMQFLSQRFGGGAAK